MSASESPTFILQSFMVEYPTACTTRVMVPFSLSAVAIVRGIRSPSWSVRIITKFPALRARAIRGASTTSLYTFSENRSFTSILFIFAHSFLLIICKVIDYSAKCQNCTVNKRFLSRHDFTLHLSGNYSALYILTFRLPKSK